jgi:glycine oxidase
MAKKVLIVGGGIVGCVTAMQMVKCGCDVTIVERNFIASQTSGESSWAGAGILFPLLPWAYGAEVNQLAMMGAALYPEICQELLFETGINAELLQSGMHILPPVDMQKATEWCTKQRMEYALVDSGLNPFLQTHTDKALWLPTVNQVRPPYLMVALRAWLLKYKVTLREQTLLKPLQENAQSNSQLNTWQTEAGEYLNADIFIVTSGAWSFELLKDTASGLAIKPMRGQILLYQPQQNLKTMVYQDGFYMVPRADGYLLAGSTLEDVGFDTKTTDDVRDSLQRKAESLMPSLKNQPIIKHWSGLRPGTPDNIPTIAAHPHITNLYLNTGHFRYGLTMAPMSALKIANLISQI